MEQLPPIELRYLRYFVAVAEELNYRQAAKRLHVSAPALSVQIKNLENLLEVRLFERDTTQVSLTPPGEVLLREARKLLQKMGDLVQATKEAAHSGSGRLRVGIHGQFGENFMPELLQAYNKAFSEVDVTLLESVGNEPQLKALEEGRVDIAFIVGFQAPQIKGLDHLLTIDVPMRAVMAVKHPLAASKQVTLEQLAGETLLAIQQYEAQTENLRAILRKEKLQPKNLITANSFYSCITMLAAMKGVAILPEVGILTKNPKLALRPIKNVPSSLRLQVYAVWKKDGAPEQTLNFVTLLRQTVAQHE